MAVTIKEIGRIAGVSHSVVSAVLNGTTANRVSQVKREKILDTAREMHYRPNFAARSLVKQRTRILGFICGGIYDPFFAELTEAMLTEAEIRGYRIMSLMTNWSREKELERLNLLLDSSVDGIIMYSSALTPESREYQKLYNDKFPLVLLDNYVPDFTCINFDVLSGMEQLFELLLKTGHRRIASVFSIAESNNKRNAYLHCCQKYDVELLEYTYHFDNNTHNWESVSECAAKIAGIRPLPDALVAFSDSDASAIIGILCQHGIRVPEDMSVTGIDGTNIGGINNPPLTTILIDRKKMARMVIDELLAQIDNPSAYQPRQLEEPTSLIERGSVKDRRAKIINKPMN